MSDQDPSVRGGEPVVHKKDRMAWPLLALIVAAVLLIVIFALFPSSPKVAAPNPRAEVPQQPGGGDQLQISNLKMTVSQPIGNMVSVKVAGTIQNVGGPKVNGATVEATFMDNTGHAAIDQTQPIERITPQGRSGKDVALKDAPLKPNDTGAFEVTFTGVPQNWNKEMPQIRIVDVATTAPPLPESSGPMNPASNTEGAGSESAKPTPSTPKHRKP
jgi:hypothetical protein